MKIKTIFQAFLYGTLTFFVGPLIFIKLNKLFSLPILYFTGSKLIGILLLLTSVSIFLYCVNIFWFFGKGTPALSDSPKKLVINGLYKYSRNPIYVAHSLILLSYALYLGHFLLYIYFLLAVISYNLLIILYEEPHLKKKFRKDYEEYLEKVPRWF